MYLPRGYTFYKDPEILCRLARDPAWLAGLGPMLSELILAYLRNVRAARVPVKVYQCTFKC